MNVGALFLSLPFSAAEERLFLDATNSTTVTGIFLAEAALSLLKDDVTAKKFGGGFLTPATLGEPYIDRLRDAGFKIETKMILEDE